MYNNLLQQQRMPVQYLAKLTKSSLGTVGSSSQTPSVCWLQSIRQQIAQGVGKTLIDIPIPILCQYFQIDVLGHVHTHVSQAPLSGPKAICQAGSKD